MPVLVARGAKRHAVRKVSACQEIGGQAQCDPKGHRPLFSLSTRDKARGTAGIGRAGHAGAPIRGSRSFPVSGGRSWWAHFEFTRINIEPIILK